LKPEITKSRQYSWLERTADRQCGIFWYYF